MPSSPLIDPLLACPGCTLNDPAFLRTCFIVGTIPITHCLLRPFVRPVKKWGIPRMNIARFASLLILVSGLVPFWQYSVLKGTPERFPLHFAGIVLALAYFWWRGCWLLDQHHITGNFKALLFPGALGLAMAALGSATAILLLGILPSIPFGAEMILYHLSTMLMVVVPLYLGVKVGLRYTFSRSRESQRSSEISQGLAD